MTSRTGKTAVIIWRAIKYALLFCFLAIIIILVLLSSAYRDLRSAAENSLIAKKEATQATSQLKSGELKTALSAAQQAEEHFSAALQNLNNVRHNPAVKYIPLIKRQIDDCEYLIRTGEILSRSLERAIPIAEQVKDVRYGNESQNFTDWPIEKKQALLTLLYQSVPELNGLKANLDLALLNLDKIHRIGVLWPVYSQISDIRAELTSASDLLEKAIPAAQLLPVLAGYPDNSRFLIILQNNDELRPTGGFIGVYAILETKNGEITSLWTDDSYHLDMPASQSDKWTEEPPAEIKKYLKVEKWYLRDANWSPNWPTSAQDILKIYQGELEATDQETAEITGVIAINPDLVSDLISLVGPITVRGETYTADNLQPLLQYNVEIDYKEQGISSWDRKEIINELTAELKTRLFHLSGDQWNDLVAIINRNIAQRNFQVFFNNPLWQQKAEPLLASGEVKKTAGDYLMVVDSNFGAFKSDVAVKKNIGYHLEQRDGQLIATVHLTYRHEGDFDWRTTRYRSYTRIYAPSGSHLRSLTGLPKETQDLKAFEDQELDKTTFGFFLTVEPGETSEITLEYELPKRINQMISEGQYQVLVQKQSGNRIEGLVMDFSFDRAIKKASLPNLKTNGKKATLNTNLDIDRPLTIYFR